MGIASPTSLRGRLLLYLFVAILVAALAQAFSAYRAARAEADEIFDYHMQQMARSLRSGVASYGSAIDQAPEGGDADFVVQIWTSEGLRIFQSSSHPVLPQRAVLGFSTHRTHGATYRVFSMQSRTKVIQVAQDMAVRREIAGSMALRTVTPIILVAPALMLLVWWVVSTSLAPVARVRRQVARRQAVDLTEVSDAGLPDEIQPLVSELNLLFSRVRQAFEAQKNFVADAAHELRSPLAALKLQAQALQRAGDDATREAAVARLSAGIDRATRLVEQLLALARQQAGASAGQPREQVVLAELARLEVAEIAAQAQARRVDIGVGETDDAVVSGYPQALRILLRNLLENALKYTPTGGVVDVLVRRELGTLLLEVEDSGPGIAEDERARALDRFYRVSGTETTGSGLGLSIVKSIADLHGATLVLDRSERLGGLRVRVSFPQAR